MQGFLCPVQGRTVIPYPSDINPGIFSYASAFSCKFAWAAHTNAEVITLGRRPEQRKARLKKVNAGTFLQRIKQAIAPKKHKD
ncbi:hypothetical protein SDC9_59063 [bioreactor metagenome]|uniref:Uncharacterized protein n=1 Tax=bioreactor metagenome TaxID=1076179 RepID=A0A644X9G9_9ZZZZ